MQELSGCNKQYLEVTMLTLLMAVTAQLETTDLYCSLEWDNPQPYGAVDF